MSQKKWQICCVSRLHILCHSESQEAQDLVENGASGDGGKVLCNRPHILVWEPQLPSWLETQPDRKKARISKKSQKNANRFIYRYPNSTSSQPGINYTISIARWDGWNTLKRHYCTVLHSSMTVYLLCILFDM